MSRQPLVTVGIPAYNRPAGLRAALASVSAQTYPQLEIVISDNASPDPGVEAVAREAAARDPRVRYHRQATNIGASKNFEYVARAATGAYFMWLADDDGMQPTLIERLAEYLERYPQIVLAAADVEIRQDRHKLVELAPIRLERVLADWPRIKPGFFTYPIRDALYMCIYGLYRTAALQACNLDLRSHWKNQVIGAETLLLAQIAARGAIVSHPEPLKLYGAHGGSVTTFELSNRDRLDTWIRDTEIRARTSLIGLTAEGSAGERARLGAYPWLHWVQRAQRAVQRRWPRAT